MRLKKEYFLLNGNASFCIYGECIWLTVYRLFYLQLLLLSTIQFYIHVYTHICILLNIIFISVSINLNIHMLQKGCVCERNVYIWYETFMNINSENRVEQLVDQDQLILPENMSSPPVHSEVSVASSSWEHEFTPGP